MEVFEPMDFKKNNAIVQTEDFNINELFKMKLYKLINPNKLQRNVHEINNIKNQFNEILKTMKKIDEIYVINS